MQLLMRHHCSSFSCILSRMVKQRTKTEISRCRQNIRLETQAIIKGNQLLHWAKARHLVVKNKPFSHLSYFQSTIGRLASSPASDSPIDPNIFVYDLTTVATRWQFPAYRVWELTEILFQPNAHTVNWIERAVRLSGQATRTLGD